MYAATGGLHKHWPLTLRHWQDEEDRGSIASVMSESILLIVPSMDGLQTNPMYVSKPVCVCVYCTSLLWTERRAFQEKCSTRNDRLATACSPLYSQPALLSNPLSDVEWIMIGTRSPCDLAHAYKAHFILLNKKGKKNNMCEELKDCFAYKNPVWGASSLFQSTAAGEVCLHLALLCDWLTGYRAEQRASQGSGEEGIQGFSSGTWCQTQEGDRELIHSPQKPAWCLRNGPGNAPNTIKLVVNTFLIISHN